jgi:hypothetical protein
VTVWFSAANNDLRYIIADDGDGNVELLHPKPNCEPFCSESNGAERSLQTGLPLASASTWAEPPGYEKIAAHWDSVNQYCTNS